MRPKADELSLAAIDDARVEIVERLRGFLFHNPTVAYEERLASERVGGE